MSAALTHQYYHSPILGLIYVDYVLQSLDLMNTNYEAELSERVYTDLTDYVEQFPLYKVW